MVNKPIKIKDFTTPIENTRELLMKETDDKIVGRKGFIFKGFVTEKERIKNYLEERNKYVKEDQDKIYFDSHEGHNENKKKHYYGIDNVKYVQPQMRFKPRTGLERIFDAINEYSFGRVSKDVVNKQLRKLDLNNMRKLKNEGYDSNEDEEINISREKRKRLSSMNMKEKIAEKERQENLARMEEENINKDKVEDKFKSKRKIVDNSAARHLMKEYHYKTHFKAASVVASRMKDEDKLERQKERDNESTQNKITRGNNELNSSNLNDEANYKATMSKTSGNYTKQFGLQNASKTGGDIFQKFSQKFSLEEENLDIIECNPLLYNLNMNPLKRNNTKEAVEQDKLEYLIRLATEKKQEAEHTLKKKPGVKFFKNLKIGKRKLNSTIGDNPLSFFIKFERDALNNDPKRGFYLI
jgi:hypothetical protein